MSNFIRPRQTKRFISGAIATLFILLQAPLFLLASPLASAAAPANGGNIDCPAGTTLLAKYNFTGGVYVAESGADSVTVTGSATDGTFIVNGSNTLVTAVVVKGGTDAKTTPYTPGVTTGTFNNVGLVNGGGQTPAISNVKICGTTTIPVVMATTVTPATIEFTDPCGTANDTFTIPTTTGVDYQIGGVTIAAGTHHTTGVLSVTVTAVAQEGYAFAEDTETTQTLTFTNVPCETETDPNVTLCHATGSDSHPYEEITVSAAGAYDGHYRIHEDDITPTFTYNGHTYQARGNQTQLAAHCLIPVVLANTVTPAAIQFSNTCGTTNDTFTIPTTTGVDYQIDGDTVDAGTYHATGIIVVTAVPQEGYTFSVGAVTSQTPTFTDAPCDSASVTLCHATGSVTNPFVQIDVNAAGAFNGHYQQHDTDIIPPFTYNGHSYSLNFDTVGQATFNNGCVPEHVGLGGGPVNPTAVTVLSILTPPKTVAQNTVAVGNGGANQLVNTGSTMLLNLFAGMFLIGTAATLTATSRRRSA